MRVDITFNTNRFNTSEIKDNFINDCCFGEDFATWLSKELASNGVDVTEIDQEDWGWYFYVSIDNFNYFIGVNGCNDENDVANAEWRVMIDKVRSFKDKIFGKNKFEKNEKIIAIIYDILKLQEDFKNILISEYHYK